MPDGCPGGSAAEKEDGMVRIFPLRLPRFLRRGAPPAPETGSGSSREPDRRSSRTASLLRAGMVLLLCGLIAFSIHQVVRHMSVGLSTLRTQEIVDESYVRMELYIFRDESVLYAEGSGVTLYTVGDGERVGVGSQMGTAYGTGSLSAAEAEALQARLNAYGERIALLRELGGLGTPADARAEAEAIDKNYLGLLEAAARGDLAGSNGFAGEMLAGIGRHDILTGKGGSVSVSSLRAEQTALLAELSPVATIRSDRGGYFYYDADGYESVFPYAEAMTMTPEVFRAMTQRPAAAVPMGVVGKLVHGTTWYAATYIPLDPDAADRGDREKDRTVELFQAGLSSGQSYRMRCVDSAGIEVDLTIERLVPDEGGVLLVFSSQDMPAGFDFSRKLRVETVAGTRTGYRIPKEALVSLRSDKTGETVEGVYILTGGVVEFRKVRIELDCDGYIIADTYEELRAYLDGLSDEAYAAATADGWSYLRLNDNIIIGGNELYEGKMIS